MLGRLAPNESWRAREHGLLNKNALLEIFCSRSARKRCYRSTIPYSPYDLLEKAILLNFFSQKRYSARVIKEIDVPLATYYLANNIYMMFGEGNVIWKVRPNTFQPLSL
jgi:hypothetical protein